MTQYSDLHPDDDAVGLNTFIALVVVCGVLIGTSILNPDMPKPEDLEETAEVSTQASSTHDIFENSKEAPKLSDLEARYDTADSATLAAIHSAMHSAWIHSMTQTRKAVSFGDFISQYYYANATDSVHPWLTWYETHGQEFANE